MAFDTTSSSQSWELWWLEAQTEYRLFSQYQQGCSRQRHPGHGWVTDSLLPNSYYLFTDLEHSTFRLCLSLLLLHYIWIMNFLYNFIWWRTSTNIFSLVSSLIICLPSSHSLPLDLSPHSSLCFFPTLLSWFDRRTCVRNDRSGRLLDEETSGGHRWIPWWYIWIRGLVAKVAEIIELRAQSMLKTEVRGALLLLRLAVNLLVATIVLLPLLRPACAWWALKSMGKVECSATCCILMSSHTEIAEPDLKGKARANIRLFA